MVHEEEIKLNEVIKRKTKKKEKRMKKYNMTNKPSPSTRGDQKVLGLT